MNGLSEIAQIIDDHDSRSKGKCEGEENEKKSEPSK